MLRSHLPALIALAPALIIGRVVRSDADPDARAIDAIFAQYDHTNTPGCALGVFRDGRVIYSRGYGMADLNQGVPITPITPFYVASTSKQFTAFSVALAAEQGRLSLDDPIRKYVPELPAYADPITVRQLIGHVSGIRDYLGLWGVSGRSFADEIPEPVALDLIARQKALDFAPGSQWSYSNSGYFLLSVIVKRATRLSLRQFADRNIFLPLGMAATHFHDDNQEIVPRRAEGYETKADGGYRVVRTSFAGVGDGGLYTTVEDLLKWDRNFYDNRLGTGSKALIDQVQTKGKLNDGSETRYAFGLVPGSHRGLPTVEHGGSFIGYRAQLLRFPGEHFSVAVLCNEASAAPEQLAYKVADLYLANTLVAESPPVSTPNAPVAAERLDRYVGRYEVMPGMVATVKREGSTIVVGAFGQSFPLAAVSDSVFTAAGLPGRFEFRSTSSSRVSLLATELSRAPAPQLGDPPSLDAAMMAAVAGRYTSEELDTWTTIAVRDNALSIRRRFGEWVPLQPLSADAFLASGARLAISRDAKGRVIGFRLSAARLANVEFVRTPAPAARR